MKMKILSLRRLGKTYDEIVELLGCSKSTVAYHCSKKVRKSSHKARLRNRKKALIELKLSFGGKCSLCGYNKCLTSLSFHHKNEKSKIDGVSNILFKGNGKKAAFEEAKKCILVCANCHGEIEEKKRKTYEGHEMGMQR